MKPNKKKWIKRAVILVILIALAIGLYFLINALYNTEKELTHGEPVVHHYDDKPEILTLETDALKFEFDTATTHFTLTQKESGRSRCKRPCCSPTFWSTTEPRWAWRTT